MSAFLYFSQEKRRQIKSENPTLRNTEVSRKLGEMWREASAEERAPHIAKEKVEREKYKVRIADWREDFEKKQEEQRKMQAEQAAQQAASMASMYSTNAQENVQSNEPVQYNYSAASGAGGYDPNMMSQQQQQYMAQQQQQQSASMYGYQQPSGAYPPAYGQMACKLMSSWTLAKRTSCD
jgi:hypothetical protein